VPVSVKSYAKINIGLRIGPRRNDGFHQLRTVYQTISLHDTVRVDVGRGTGIEIRCKDQRVPADESNTCWRVADRVMRSLKKRGKVAIAIDKRLPVQGGIGGASSNAVATMLAMERVLKEQLGPEERLRIASEVGSDLPLFLVGGTVLGTGRGEQVWPLQDLPPIDCVIATPPVGVSTPEAFRDWDQQFGADSSLTDSDASDRINVFSQSAYAWLAGSLAGVPAEKGGGRAEKPLLDLVRAGIENDFERVVFPKHPELREVKRALEREGAQFASLSGSGSTLFGLFDSTSKAQQAARRLNENRIPAEATRTLPRQDYWDSIFDF
jgi:4-diphosphocytidyl-2-C-methyl-D-erythritol kinase